MFDANVLSETLLFCSVSLLMSAISQARSAGLRARNGVMGLAEFYVHVHGARTAAGAAAETLRADPSNRQSDRKMVELFEEVGSEIFRCSGCDSHFVRGRPGYVSIGEGFEFCSELCAEEPMPFPSIARPMRLDVVTDDRALKAVHNAFFGPINEFRRNDRSLN